MFKNSKSYGIGLRMENVHSFLTFSSWLPLHLSEIEWTLKHTCLFFLLLCSSHRIGVETLSLALATEEGSGDVAKKLAKALNVGILLPDNGPIGQKVKGLLPFILAFG